jgi:hypothetical protein
LYQLSGMTAVGSEVNITQHDHIGMSLIHACVSQSNNGNVKLILTARYLIVKHLACTISQV